MLFNSPEIPVSNNVLKVMSKMPVSEKKRVYKKMERKGSFYVYIVVCKNGTYYTGYTSNLEHRIKLHNSGDGAKYLKGKSPVTLAYSKEYVYYKNALNAERRIKKLTRKRKEALIEAYKKNPCRSIIVT